MNEILNTEMRGLGEHTTRGLEPWEDEPGRRNGASPETRTWGTTLILGAMGILVVALMIALFTRGGSELKKEDLAELQSRQGLLDEKLTRLEKALIPLVEEGVRRADLARHEAELDELVKRMERSMKFLTIRVEKLTEDVNMIKNGSASPSRETGSPFTIQRMPLSFGKETYHMVRPGDTLYKIAQQYGTSVEELCRLNNTTPGNVIYSGQRLLVATGGTE